MAELFWIRDGEPVTSSLLLAERFFRKHYNITAELRELVIRNPQLKYYETHCSDMINKPNRVYYLIPEDTFKKYTLGRPSFTSHPLTLAAFDADLAKVKKELKGMRLNDPALEPALEAAKPDEGFEACELTPPPVRHTPVTEPDTSDIPEADETFFQNAQVRFPSKIMELLASDRLHDEPGFAGDHDEVSEQGSDPFAALGLNPKAAAIAALMAIFTRPPEQTPPPSKPLTRLELVTLVRDAELARIAAEKHLAIRTARANELFEQLRVMMLEGPRSEE